MTKIKRAARHPFTLLQRAMDATDKWVERLGYQGRHWAPA